MSRVSPQTQSRAGPPMNNNNDMMMSNNSPIRPAGMQQPPGLSPQQQQQQQQQQQPFNGMIMTNGGDPYGLDAPNTMFKTSYAPGGAGAMYSGGGGGMVSNLHMTNNGQYPPQQLQLEEMNRQQQQQQQYMTQQMGPVDMNGMNGGGSMYNMNNAGFGGSMYGQGFGDSMYGMSSMYGGGMGGGTAAVNPYGMGGSMYGSGYNGIPGMGMGSMYASGMGSMFGGSMYSMGSRFRGSLYGGSLFGPAGSIYSQGGSLYGSNDTRSVMGSMYGMGGMFEVRSHTNLGTVRKLDIPNFSYTFQSDYGSSQRKTTTLNASSPPSASKDKPAKPSSSSSGSEPAKEEKLRRNTAHDIGEREKAATTSLKEEPATTAVSPKAVGRRFSTEKNESMTRSRGIGEVAPKSPTASTVRTSSGRNLTLSTDYRIHTISVIERSGVSMPKVKQVAETNRLIVDKKVSKRELTFDEVINFDPAKANENLESKQIKDMFDHFLAGHNAAVLIANANGNANAATTATLHSVGKVLFDRLDKLVKITNNSSKYYLTFRMSAIKSNPDVAKDLLQDNATFEPIEMGGSPLFGPTIMGKSSLEVRDFASYESLVAKMLCNSKNGGDDDHKMLCGSIVMKLVRGHTAASSSAIGKDARPDMFLASLLIAINNSGASPYIAIADAANRAPPRDMFRYAIGGAGVTVAAMCVKDSDEVSGDSMDELVKLGEVKNTAPRSGNVGRFLDFTDAQYETMKDEARRASGSAKEELDLNIERLGAILKDTRNMYENPDTVEAKAYHAAHRSRQQDPSEQKIRSTTESKTGEATGVGASESKLDENGLPKSSSNPLETVVIADTDDAGEERRKRAKYVVKEKTLLTSGEDYTVDEVVPRDKVTPKSLGSTVVESVMKSYMDGANVALLAVDTPSVAVDVFESPAWAPVRAAVASSLERSCDHIELRGLMCLVRSDGQVMDLSEAKCEWQPLASASSPLFGPVLNNYALKPLATAHDFEALLDGARRHLNGYWGKDTAIYCFLVQFFTTGKESVVSSLLSSFAGANAGLFVQLAEKRSSLGEIFRYALGGTANTVIVATLDARDDADAVAAAMKAVKVCGRIQNRPLRRGSINTFVTSSKASLEKRMSEIDASISSVEDRAREKRKLAPMRQMAEEYEAIMENPKTSFPKVYTAARPAALAQQQRALPAVVVEAPNIKDQPTAAAGVGVKQTDVIKPQIVAFINDRAVAAAALKNSQKRQVTIKGTAYPVDEIVPVGHASETLESLANIYRNVQNVSILGARNTNFALADEPVFVGTRKIATALFPPAADGDVTVEFSVCVISPNEVIFDAFSDSAPDGSKRRPLVVASSPIFGPRVDSIAIQTLDSERELTKALDTALCRMQSFVDGHWDASYVIVTSVVQCFRTTSGDVELASLLSCLSGPSAPMYVEDGERDAARSGMLTCAIKGPCATVCLLSYDAAKMDEAEDMTSTLSHMARHTKNMPMRSGSVKAFIEYTESAFRKFQTRIDASSGERKAHMERKQARISEMLNDYRRLLTDKDCCLPMYASANTSHSSRASEDGGAGASSKSPTAANAKSHHSSDATGTRLSTLAVITGQRAIPSEGSTVTLAVTDNHFVEATATNGTSTQYLFDRIITRPSSSSPVRAESVDELAEKVSSGFNAALLCCDAPNSGSDVGISLTLQVVKTVFEKLSQEADIEVYYAIFSQRDGDARDLLAGGSSYKSACVGISPLFGPCVDDVALNPLDSASLYEKTLVQAAAEAAKEGATCISLIVFKKISETRTDVALNSFLVVLDTPDARAMCRALSGNKSDRGMFRYALGGSCYTVACAGLADKTTSGDLGELLKLFVELRNIKNSAPRSGSLQRFLQFTNDAVKGMEARMSKASGQEKASYQSRIDTLKLMRADAESMISNPTGVVPQTYPLHSSDH